MRMGVKVQSSFNEAWIDVLMLNTRDTPSIRGHWCIPKYVDGERTSNWWLQVSRHSNESRLLFQNKWSEVDGMESARRKELRHPPSTNMRYSTTLCNVEELRQDVHEPVTVLGMAEMQSQDNWGMVKSSFNFLQIRAYRKMLTEGRKHGLDMQTGTSLRHRRHE